MKLDVKKKAVILRIVAESGSVRKAAKKLKVSFQAIYLKRTTDARFAAGFVMAMREYQEKLETEADRRAYEGVDHPVTYEGEITATYKDYSDTLLMFRLKRLDPAYRDSSKVELTGKDNGPIQTKSMDGFDVNLYAKLLGAVTTGVGNGAGVPSANGDGKQIHSPHTNGEAGGVS